jgi:L-asparagine oxygenase
MGVFLTRANYGLYKKKFDSWRLFDDSGYTRNFRAGFIRTPSSLPVSKCPESDLLNKEILEFVSVFGEPFGFDNEQGGALVQDLFPIKKNETEQISSSSKVELEMHTETAFHPKAPHFVVLFCVRGDSNAGTTFANLGRVLDRLRQKDIDTLSQKLFITTVDKSFLDEGEKNREVKTRVIHRNGGKMVYDSTAMRGMNAEAQAALNNFTKLVQKEKFTIALQSGQIAIIDNWQTAHGRTEFTPRYDGTDRWIKRVFVKNKKSHRPLINNMYEEIHYWGTTNDLATQADEWKQRFPDG